MAEDSSCCSPYHEEYIQTCVSRILRVYVVKLIAFHQQRDECRIFCCILTTYEEKKNHHTRTSPLQPCQEYGCSVVFLLGCAAEMLFAVVFKHLDFTLKLV